MLTRHHIVLHSRGQHQQMPCVKIMHLAFGRHLKMTVKRVNHDDTLCPVMRQAREMAEEKQRHSGGAALVQRLLAVPGLAGLEFLPELRRHLAQIILVLRRNEPISGMLSQSLGLGNLLYRLRFVPCHGKSLIKVGHEIENALCSLNRVNGP